MLSVMSGSTLVVAGGVRPDPLVVAALPEIARCVAADSGADLALGLDLPVDVLVGDLDSISDAGLEQLRSRGVAIRQFPSDKDKTDLELALEVALEGDPAKVVVIGLAGGRLDHALANIGALAAAVQSAADGTEIDGLIGSARLGVIRGQRTLHGALGETISLLPVLGAVEGVTTTGLEYPLVDEPLAAGTSRGVSNRFVANQATIEVRSGVLVAVQPFALRDHQR